MYVKKMASASLQVAYCEIHCMLVHAYNEDANKWVQGGTYVASTPGSLTFDIEIGGPGSRWHVTLDTP